MTESVDETPEQLVERIREALRVPPLVFSSDPGAVAQTEPYRRLVGLGEPALGFLMSRLEEGDHFLNTAVMEIAGVGFDDLSLPDFPSENEVAAALVEWMAPVPFEFYWTAVGSAAPAADFTTPPPPATATVQQQTPRLTKGRLEQVFANTLVELRG